MTYVTDSSTPVSVDRKIIDKTLDIACEGHNVEQVVTKMLQQEYGSKQLIITIYLQEKGDE